MTFTPQWLDELRSRVTLSGVIMRTTKLQKSGREWKACCPFHNEKTPSFTVNDEKGFYHCFGCGAHGDVIRWMTEQRGLGFMDAVKELASTAGMEVPAPNPQAVKEAEHRVGLTDVMTATQEWFKNNLMSAEGEKAREYLKKRGFEPLTIQLFGFGYAPEGRQALKAAIGEQFSEPMMIEAGLRIQVEDKEPYDRFRGRLMLPIEDTRGRIIGFGGRILDNTKIDAPKYLNSPDTPLFDKGRTLYNLNRAGPISRQTNRIIVVEGYMDVIALTAAGIGEAVAPMGTALTEAQLELLWRLIETPILCFDGDSAGQRAAMRAIVRALPLLRPAHSLNIVRLPVGLDPDDLIRRDGPEAMEAVLTKAKTLVETLWEYERDAVPLTTPEDKAGLKSRLLAHVDTIVDQDIRALYRRELLQRFSAFAFPPRDWSRTNNVHNITEAKRWASTQHRGKASSFEVLKFVPRPSQELIERHANPNDRDLHLQRRLGAAVCAGLLRFPQFSLLYAESLLDVPNVDPRLEMLVEAAYLDVLEREQLEALLTENDHKLPHSQEWDDLRFPFTWPPSDDEDAADGLERAIKLYAGRPQIKAALKEATKRLAENFTDENYHEQQRLRRRQSELEREFGLVTKAA